MTARHDQFEVLCVLSASEELTETEVQALRRHAMDCAGCRNRILEMTDLKSHLMLAHGLKLRKGRLPEGMRERFVSRAIAEGVPITPQAPVYIGKLGLTSLLFAALLIVAAVVNHVVPTRSIQLPQEASAEAVNTNAHAADHAIQLLPGRYGKLPARISIPRHSVRRRGSFARPPQRLFPMYQGVFENRDFSIRLNSTLDTSLRSRFASPPVLRRSNALNLLANFEPRGPSPQSRTFEYSGNTVYRFLLLSGCEPR